MIFIIEGFPKNGDTLAFEKELGLTADELTPIMGWESEEDYVGVVCTLSDEQVNRIEQLLGRALPRDLELFLANYE
ncbi:hypothetical protein BZL41_08660 [Pseudomonas sp. PIC25]|uniref:pyocin S6 family toxin immunity protein n=1 Tax=Pseudomonas sp. PIC25 TaxID=1958773 RepID=UPI000BAB75F0|nr:pyocin S6 family toxin immunity protein [Pseudomonas sp. PIC25]PAU64873.1 hypothetical protein BZL41_08660 [Pseudomonas sp. PIC25]